MKRLDFYRSLPYTIMVRRNPEGVYEASIAELNGCLSHGATPEEAIRMVEDARRCWIEANLEAGDPIPEPDPPYLEEVIRLYDLHLAS